MANTRKQIRRYILRDLGDLLVLTATSDGSTQTFYDAVNLTGGINTYQGRHVRFTGGTADNLGLERYVTGSSAEQRAIGFGIELAADTAEGDECEMINTRGTGYRFQDVHDAINFAIESMGPQSLVVGPFSESTFAYGTGITIPPDFLTIENVWYQDSYDDAKWHSIQASGRSGGLGWWVDRSDRTVMITGKTGSNLDAYTVRISGLVQPQSLYDDNDETTVDLLWLVWAAEANLARAKHMRMPTPENERLMYLLQQQAQRFANRVMTRRSAFSVGV